MRLNCESIPVFHHTEISRDQNEDYPLCLISCRKGNLVASGFKSQVLDYSKLNMKNLIEFLKDIFKTEYIIEMATICRSIKLDSRRFYKIAIHGPSTKDRDYPHIHIYDANDNTLKLFNFEISVIDIICNDELNIILQVDRSKHIRRTNRSECSWDGYAELRDNFEN